MLPRQIFLVSSLFGLFALVAAAMYWKPEQPTDFVECSEDVLRTVKFIPDSAGLKAISYYVIREERRSKKGDYRLRTALDEAIRLQTYSKLWKQDTIRQFCSTAKSYDKRQAIVGFDNIVSEVKRRFPSEKSPSDLALCLTVEHINLARYAPHQTSELKQRCEVSKQNWKILGTLLRQ